MKRYESVSQVDLTRRTPVIVRLDGKAFHTYSRRFKSSETPFSAQLHELMIQTTEGLLRTQNCVFGYTQSDEISLLFRDWDTTETQAFFDYNVQKMVSVLASDATAYFTGALISYSYPDRLYSSDIPRFDARVFNVPESDVVNYFVWRQQDAMRNSVQMLGQHVIGHKAIQGLNNTAVKDTLVREYGTHWESQPLWAQRGSCVNHSSEKEACGIDRQIPVFTQDREYVARHLKVEND